MLEHLLETQVQVVGPNDPFLDDFLLTHIVFLPVPRLIEELSNQYPFHNNTKKHLLNGPFVLPPSIPHSVEFSLTANLREPFLAYPPFIANLPRMPRTRRPRTTSTC